MHTTLPAVLNGRHSVADANEEGPACSAGHLDDYCIDPNGRGAGELTL